MTKTNLKRLIGELELFVPAKFFYNPIMKTTSPEFKRIWEDICDEYSSESQRSKQDRSERIRDVRGNVRYLSSKILPCTPLQAYLLEFNRGYERV